MNTTHTPGPWTHIPRARDGHVDKIAFRGRVFIDVGSPVAEYPILDEPHENTQTANARLVAAAPELLAVCKSALRALKDNLQPGPMDADAIAGLCDVIAKATGGIVT